MGVCASGKSTFGAQLASRLGCIFHEGDSFHSDANIEKMRGGTPLTDDDRWPWLDHLAAALGASARSGGVAVAACSALKRSYRQRLSASAGVPLRFLMLKAPAEELTRRLASRQGHYMPPTLLASQLAALEEPCAGEPALIMDACRPADELLDEACRWLTCQPSIAAL
ncbi:gluconokinase [Phenylobacterium deserti]|uniref:Gluconokinase n=2 Tax=Phenylobacterium deserti TaxID=1914756 RepID=A0A328AG79_9CAUL|nr:gluconokinase [Phenylobacterium deserti]